VDFEALLDQPFLDDLPGLFGALKTLFSVPISGLAVEVVDAAHRNAAVDRFAILGPRTLDHQSVEAGTVLPRRAGITVHTGVDTIPAGVFGPGCQVEVSDIERWFRCHDELQSREA
jgi:hypothetical protein